MDATESLRAGPAMPRRARTHDDVAPRRHAVLRPCRCGSRVLVRSRRKHLEIGLSWIGLLPYRCLRCERRCYRFTS